MANSRKILITGGGGFLGGTVAQRLLEYRKESSEPFEVVTLDLLPTRIPQWSHCTGSVLDMTVIQDAARGCDTVVHLAGLLGVEQTEKRRLDCLNINIRGTLSVLDSCVQDRVKKIIFTSSSEVYGDQTNGPIRETHDLHPKSIYAISKLAGEEYVKSYCERFDMNYVIFRPFNIYGVHQVGQFVIPKFVRAALEGTPLNLYGGGSQVRAFCYGTDFADGIVASIFSDRVNNQTLNIGNESEPITMEELAERILKWAGKPKLKPQHVEDHQADRVRDRDVQWRVPDLSKLRSLIPYQPKVNLDEGIQKLISHGKIAGSWADRSR